MAKLGILATAGVSGDLPPVMALALGLAGRGHRVEFLAGQELASIAEGVGLRATITDPKHDVGPQILDAVREAQGMDLGAQGVLIDRRLREWEENLAQVVGDWAGRERVDAVLGPLFAVGVCHRAIPGQRWCVVNSTYSLDPATLGEDCTPRAFPLLARFAALLEHAPLVLHATDATYDRDRELPPTQHHVGPLFWEPPATVPAWLEEPGDPWALISLSVAIVCLLTASLFGARGGSDDGPSRKAVISKGDAICSQGAKEQAPIEAATVGPAYHSGGTPTLEQFRSLFVQIAPIVGQELAAFRGLQPPRGDTALFERWAETSRVIEGKLAVVLQAASSGNQAAFDAALADLSKASEPWEAEMRSDGFKVCGAEEE